jgi:hypothetical protein
VLLEQAKTDYESTGSDSQEQSVGMKERETANIEAHVTNATLKKQFNEALRERDSAVKMQVRTTEELAEAKSKVA